MEHAEILKKLDDLHALSLEFETSRQQRETMATTDRMNIEFGIVNRMSEHQTFTQDDILWAITTPVTSHTQKMTALTLAGSLAEPLSDELRTALNALSQDTQNKDLAEIAREILLDTDESKVAAQNNLAVTLDILDKIDQHTLENAELILAEMKKLAHNPNNIQARKKGLELMNVEMVMAKPVSNKDFLDLMLNESVASRYRYMAMQFLTSRYLGDDLSDSEKLEYFENLLKVEAQGLPDLLHAVALARAAHAAKLREMAILLAAPTRGYH